jgi:hypothetical protein
MSTEFLHTFGPSLAGAALIVAVHMLAGKMHFLERWDGTGLDFVAGIAMAYVFIDILPHLAGKQERFAELSDQGIYGFIAHHVYILALAGFVIYMVLIRTEDRWRQSLRAEEVTLASASLPLKIEALSLAVYSFIIGSMLAKQPTHRIEPPLFFAAAMAAHFAGLDHLIHHRYPKLYDGALRYLLSAALLSGWLLGLLFAMSGVIYAATFAFLAGGIVIVTMIFELPRVVSPRRYWSFCGGAAAFTLILLVLELMRAID